MSSDVGSVEQVTINKPGAFPHSDVLRFPFSMRAGVFPSPRTTSPNNFPTSRIVS